MATINVDGALINGDVVSAFGENPSSASGTVETVRSSGGTFVPLATEETLSLASTSASDVSAGAGARTVKIEGLDGNFNPVRAIVTLNGTTPVVTTEAFLRVNKMVVATAGSSLVNAGTITATASTSATVQGEIPAAEGSSQDCIYTVPAGKRLFVTNWGGAIKRSTGTSSTACDFDLHIITPELVIQMIGAIAGQNDGATVPPLNYRPPLPIEEKTTVFIEGVATAVADISGYIHGYIMNR